MTYSTEALFASHGFPAYSPNPMSDIAVSASVKITRIAFKLQIRPATASPFDVILNGFTRRFFVQNSPIGEPRQYSCPSNCPEIQQLKNGMVIAINRRCDAPQATQRRRDFEEDGRMFRS
jgi:hypothetical protein